MRFDLTDLSLFLAVAEAGSITHGAADAGLSLAAASERLRDMEAAGQVILLERGRRGVTLTEAGEALVHHARTILGQMARMRGELGLYARGLRASVRIHANTAALSEHLPARLGPWLAANPQIDCELKERQSAEIARTVRAGFADLGVLSSAVETQGLNLRPFAVDRLVVVASTGSALAEKRETSFEDVLRQPFLALAGGALQDHLGAKAADHGAKLKIRLALRSFEDICRMAGQGVGVGVVPEIAARKARRSARIAIINLLEDWSVRRLSVCVSDDREPSAVLKGLLDHLGARP